MVTTIALSHWCSFTLVTLLSDAWYVRDTTVGTTSSSRAAEGFTESFGQISATCRSQQSQGKISPIVAIAAPAPQVQQRRYVTQNVNLKKYEWTDGCTACTEHSVGARAAVTTTSAESESRQKWNVTCRQEIDRDIVKKSFRRSWIRHRSGGRDRHGGCSGADAASISSKCGSFSEGSARTLEKEEDRVFRSER